jgi:hypothetical protein
VNFIKNKDHSFRVSKAQHQHCFDSDKGFMMYGAKQVARARLSFWRHAENWPKDGPPVLTSFLKLLYWRYIVEFTKILTMYLIYHSWIHLLHHSPLFPSPTPGIVSTGVIFPLTFMCIQYFHHIHPPTTFPHILPLLLVPTPQTGPVLPSCSLILWKKKIDSFVYDSCPGSFLVKFSCIYVL